MKLRFVVPCLMFAFMAVAARAQVGLYVNPVGIHVSNSQADTGPFAFLGNGNTSRTFYGVNLGGYYEFFHGAKGDVALDVRDSITKSNNATLNSFLFGLHVAAKPTKYGLKPFAQVSVGVGTTKPPTSSVHLSRGTYGIYGGVDYPLNSHVDFRAVEVSYSSLSTVSSGNFGGTTSFGASRLFGVSTGLVFRFGGPR
jgi:hypothetical protein